MLPTPDLPRVHVSEVKTFKQCRWVSEWSAHRPIGLYLEPDRPVPHFLLGRAVHFALDGYYSDPGRSYASAVDAYRAYIIQDAALVKHKTVVDDITKSKILENVELGEDMTIHYASWAPQHDVAWEVVSTEFPFPGDDRPPLVDESGVFQWEGRFDGLWRNKHTGELWVVEYKTTARPNQIEWIYKDEQPMFYAYMAQRTLDLEVAGVLYTFLTKKVPQPPRELNNGSFSISREQATSYDMFLYALQARAFALGDKLPNDNWYKTLCGEYEGYLTYLKENVKYIFRVEVRKSQQQLKINYEHMQMAAIEMLSSARLSYPTPSIQCPRCGFKDPCDVRMAGGNYNMLLEQEFHERTAWEPELPLTEET